MYVYNTDDGDEGMVHCCVVMLEGLVIVTLAEVIMNGIGMATCNIPTDVM